MPPDGERGPAGPILSAVEHDDLLAPAAEGTRDVKADQPARGILPRAPYVEVSLAPPPDKAPPLHPVAAHEAWSAPEAAGTGRLERTSADIFHRSSVGTARTPTGPPASAISI